ncbi:MAG: invasion associated locus B family protein [Pseudomonadota bacterium]
MLTLLRTLPLIVLLQIGTALSAQESTATTDDTGTQTEEDATAQTTEDATEESNDGAADTGTEGTEETTTETAQGGQSGTGLDLGREVDPSYIKEQYGDWQIQCFRTETGEDPCQMYQLLREDAGNPVAEFSVFKLPGNAEAVAGATVVVPLGTLLSEGLKISVDGGPLKGYSYAFCSIVGCFARIGFTQQDIDAFKAGSSASLIIVPAQAPDQVVRITASLDGFTAAFNEASVVEN